MFTFLIQLIDLVKLHTVGLFLIFFLCSWAVHITKLSISLRANPLKKVKLGDKDFYKKMSVTAIIPVTDEPLEVWKRTCNAVKTALLDFGKKSQVIVIANGHNGLDNIDFAKGLGFEVHRLPLASKRLAIAKAVESASGDISLILDSDTEVSPDSIKELIRVFEDRTVGGATPKHVVFNQGNSIFRRVSAWLEDIRFEELVKGQSSYGQVSCLPGRLLAVRTSLLKDIVPHMVIQRFLGSQCISGDDRFITSELLKEGYKTVYMPTSVVHTEAPDTLKGFVLQRLRWSRTSFRESLRGLKWAFNFPYLAFTTYSTIILRWFFFVVILTAILAWLGFIDRDHAVNLPFWFVILGTVAGFFLSGIFRQLRHLIKQPKDFVYLPAFLAITMFILTPVEWFGNLTLRESHWMTRYIPKPTK